MPVSKTDAPSSGAAIADKNGHVEQRPREPQKAISTATEVGIGCYLVALGAVALATTPWAWSLATSSISRTPGGRARFLGLAFTPTAEFNLIIIVMLMAVLGSIAVMIITFASRSGHRTLDSAYLWWYLTRPFEAAAVGVLFYMAIIAGFFSQTSAQGRPALVLAAAIGGSAGLFTDKVLEKMRGALLGLTAFDTATAGTTKNKVTADNKP